jgi:hypothetical protein
MVLHHFSGKVTMAPLDVTHQVRSCRAGQPRLSLAAQVLLSPEDKRRIFDNRVGHFMNAISEHYTRMYKVTAPQAAVYLGKLDAV